MKPRATHPIHLAIGLGVWMLWFSTVYGAVSVACAWVPSTPDLAARSGVNLGLLALTVLTAAALAWSAWRCWRLRRAGASGEGFFAWVNAVAYAGAAIATAVVGLPLVWLPPCV